MIRYYTTKMFRDRIENCSGIICIGVGNRFNTLLEYFETSGISDKIIMLTDNNIEKHNEKVKLGNKVLSITSVDEIKNVNMDNIMIIITCAAYKEIIAQLSGYPYFNVAEIVCFTHIFVQHNDDEAMRREIPPNVKLSDKPLIPKVIHYCWFGGNPIPDKNKRWMESWRKYCPDYEIVEWNERNYDITKNMYMCQAYKSNKWSFVSDYARLDIVYNHGGIYLDVDVELISNLDDMLFQIGFAGFESDKYVNLGLGFGAKKELPIIKEMRDYYDNITFIDENGNQNLTPCPVHQTEVLKKYGLKTDGEYQIISDLTIYPQKMFCPKSPESRLTKPKPYTHSIHHFDASWVDEKTKMKIHNFEMEMSEIESIL